MSVAKYLLFIVAMLGGLTSFMFMLKGPWLWPAEEFLYRVCVSLSLSINYDDAGTMWYVSLMFLVLSLLVCWVAAIYFLLTFLYEKIVTIRTLA